MGKVKVTWLCGKKTRECIYRIKYIVMLLISNQKNEIIKYGGFVVDSICEKKNIVLKWKRS